MKIFHIQNANDTETRVNGGGVEDFVADSPVTPVVRLRHKVRVIFIATMNPKS